MKKRVCMLYTGGTIGMVPSESGYVPSSGSFREILHELPELYYPDMPEWEVVELDPLLDSSNISVAEWNKIAGTIYERYGEFDGFVVLHGTDTMAYSASAVSFMLENLNKPVIFTGAQIPLCKLRSDGRDNLINSLLMATSEEIHEVCVYFNGVLLRGNRCVKHSSDRFGAFESPNYPVLARVGIDIQYDKTVLRPSAEGPLTLHLLDEVPVGVIKVFPGIQFRLFESIMTEELKGVVLECYGSGNIPSSEKDSLLPIIRKAYESGTIITVCSQCAQGAVSLGTYATSKDLHDIGAVNGGDMTTEAALTKLYYLLSLGLEKEAVKGLMMTDLRGELSR